MNQPLSGDEPAYMLMDYSVAHDGTFNLSKGYNDKAFQSFTPGSPTIEGSPAPGTQAPAKDYSQHGIGLPLFLLPGFSLGTLLTSSVHLAARYGAVLEMLLLATGVIVLTWIWTNEVTKNRRVAYIASGLLAISYFFSGLAGYIYPDMLTSALLLGAMIMVERYYSTLLLQILLGIILGFLVLVHIKTLDLVAPVLLVLSYKLWKTNHRLPWATFLVVALFVAYYFISYHQWFGVWGIQTANGSGGSQFGDNPLMSVSAMMFDSFRGFLVYNPVMILIFLGLPVWFKKSPKSLGVALVATLPSIAVLSYFFQWNGGDAPLGRYIIDVLPVYIPALAFAIEILTRSWEKVFIVLASLATFLITVDATFGRFPLIDPGLEANMTRSPLFIQLQQHTGLAIDRFLPMASQYLFYHTTFIDKHGLMKTIFWWLVVLAFFIYGIYLARGRGHKAPVKKRLGATL
ncbi:MAG TPA: hypothetical protein VGS08_02055 [Candidatus Saccharimonadales bacterium]|nr:hypothetical protein [Candidatus Saccharimonadales bacterium]